MQFMVVILLVAVGAVGTLLMKVGAERVVYGEGLAALLRSLVTNSPLVVGILLQLLPLAGWTVLLKTMPLTKLQPMIALTYVVTPVLAVLVLGEVLTAQRIAGIVLIVAGVILVGMGA
jgi:drug/metabolite transporter (DMT)-like permease